MVQMRVELSAEKDMNLKLRTDISALQITMQEMSTYEDELDKVKKDNRNLEN